MTIRGDYLHLPKNHDHDPLDETRKIDDNIKNVVVVVGKWEDEDQRRRNATKPTKVFLSQM